MMKFKMSTVVTKYKVGFVLLSTLTLLMVPNLLTAQEQETDKRPNILFISIDDLNDWIGPLGGHPQIETPFLDDYAKRAVVFKRAYSPATLCGPSRSAILTGRLPSETGLYTNKNNLSNSPVINAMRHKTMPQFFSHHGYHTLAMGKIFHSHKLYEPGTENVIGHDKGHWAFEDVEPVKPHGEFVCKDHSILENAERCDLKWHDHPKAENGDELKGSAFLWGPLKIGLKQTKDFKTCEWGGNKLLSNELGVEGEEGRPFFMAIGISKPHLPFIVPRQFFQTYQRKNIKRAQFRYGDLNDIRDEYDNIIHQPNDRFAAADREELHRKANQAYMASVSYVDACLNELLTKLDQSKHANNTIVVIWSDHGFYLGEKLRYGKLGLWEEAARVPLLIRAPGVSVDGGVVRNPVSLMDMYPTLIDLCGLPKYNEISGNNISNTLRDPANAPSRLVLTTQGKGNHSVTNGRFRYMQNSVPTPSGNVFELYDHHKDVDPYGFENLAGKPEHRRREVNFWKHFPKDNAEMQEN